MMISVNFFHHFGVHIPFFWIQNMLPVLKTGCFGCCSLQTCVKRIAIRTMLGSLGIIILSIMALATDNLFKDIIYLEKNVALFVVSLVGSCFYFITSVILLTSVFKGRSNGAIPWLIMSLYVIIACVIVFKFLIVVGVYLFALPFLVQSGLHWYDSWVVYSWWHEMKLQDLRGDIANPIDHELI